MFFTLCKLFKEYFSEQTKEDLDPSKYCKLIGIDPDPQ